MAHGKFTNSDVDTTETVAEIRTRTQAGTAFEDLWISFVVGTADLTEFSVAFRTHPDAGYFTIASVAADYTSPEGPVLGASASLVTAAAGATVHWLKLDVKGVESVRLQAAGTSSTITGYWGAN